MTVLVSTIPAIAIKSVGGSLLPLGDYPYLWVLGVFLVQGFFLPFTALLIAAGSMAEEYEQGTAEVLLSKPVTRDEYFAGKFLGGFMLISTVILINGIMSAAAAVFEFGAQQSLSVLPAVLVSQVYSALVFYSVAFMSGELVRRSSLSYIIASAVYLTSEIAGVILRVIFTLTGNAFYQDVNKYLPTTPVTSLPLQVSLPLLPTGAQDILSHLGTGPTETSVALSVGLIALYAVTATVLARSYFNWADVAKRVA